MASRSSSTQTCNRIAVAPAIAVPTITIDASTTRSPRPGMARPTEPNSPAAGPARLRPDDVLIEVRACGVGNWDEFARTGDWDLGIRPPMALGVEAAGFVAVVGDQVGGVKAGDRVTAHSVPYRGQGAWAEQHVAAAEHAAVLPPGASTVFDYHEPDWPERVRAMTGGGVDAAANAARAGSAAAVRAVRDGGRLATITADLPATERGITMRAVQVVPDGRRLGGLVRLLAHGLLSVSAGERFPLEQAAVALAQARHGAHGSAVVLWTADPG